jgi:hypothetical protein
VTSTGANLRLCGEPSRRRRSTGGQRNAAHRHSCDGCLRSQRLVPEGPCHVAVALPRLVHSFELRGIKLQTGLQRKERKRRRSGYLIEKEDRAAVYSPKRKNKSLMHRKGAVLSAYALQCFSLSSPQYAPGRFHCHCPAPTQCASSPGIGGRSRVLRPAAKTRVPGNQSRKRGNRSNRVC